MSEVRVYTLAGCPYCVKAKELLASYGDFVEIDVTHDQPIRRWLKMRTGRGTLPQTFVDGRPVGGYMDLQELDDAGQLPFVLQRRRFAPQ